MSDYKERLARIQKANKKIISEGKKTLPRNTNKHKVNRSPKTSDRSGGKCDYCGQRVAARNMMKSTHGQTFCPNCARWRQGRNRK